MLQNASASGQRFISVKRFFHSSLISWGMAVFDVLFTTVALAVLIAEGKIR